MMTEDSTTTLRWMLFVSGLIFVSSGCIQIDDSGEVEAMCGSGEIYVDDECLDAGACEPECSASEMCRDGRCVSADGSCEYQGQPCDPQRHLQWSDGYICLDWQTGEGQQAVCSRDCRSQVCGQGSLCYGVPLGGGFECSDATDCGSEEICHEGGCLWAVCRPSECKISDGRDTDCAAGQRCGVVENGAQFCVDQGTREVGEGCIDSARALSESRLSEGCVADAVCIGGVCQEFCESGTCAEGAECVTAQVGSNSVSICGNSCTPGSEENGCEEMETCVPGDSGEGICRPAGTGEVFESCDGDSGCEPGTICAEEEGDQGFGRCLPVCDLSVGEPDGNGQIGSDAQALRDATCPQPAVQEGLWMLWYLIEGGETLDLYLDGASEPVSEIEGGEIARFEAELGYQIRDAGWVEWEVRSAGAPSTDSPIAEGAFDLGAGQSRMLALIPEPGRDRAFNGEIIDLLEPEGVSWVQGIPDLERSDLWAFDDEGSGALWLSGIGAGEIQSLSVEAGIYDLRIVAEGAGEEGDELVGFSAVEFSGQESFVALRGTMDAIDIHAIDPPLTSSEAVPDIVNEASLSLSCRAVNGGSMGGCIEKCSEHEVMHAGRCSGEAMGCGPRYHQQRTQWSAVCQPVGSGDQGDPCHPLAVQACGEGLYCEEFGDSADHYDATGLRGRCSSLCPSGDDEFCGEGSSCRAITGATDFEIGECRIECEPGPGYEDQQCPAGQRRCKPEASLVPAGDGVSGAYEVDEEQPVCWASGSLAPGQSCVPGDCEAGNECIFQRSVQSGFVETMLSPYFASGSAPLCTPICDPFTNERTEYRCGAGETCLFNYPYNANVGHCAEISEETAVGDSCDHPGLACGEDSICIMDGGTPECIRFCQFIGQGNDGYQQSTCPSGFECGPLVNDIGICR